MKGYKTSKNYKRLKELLDRGYEVVCFTTYDFNWRNIEPHEPLMTTDICKARLLKCTANNKYDMYQFGVRGLGYLDYWPNDPSMNSYTFDEACAAENIEFIEPTEEIITNNIDDETLNS